MKHFALALFLMSMLCPGAQLFSQNSLLHLAFDEESGNTTALDSVSLAAFPIANRFDRPERIEAPKGKALRLDGHSTWVQANGSLLSTIGQQMSIELWYATECFNEQSVGLLSHISSSGGLALKASPFGKLSFQFFADGQFFNLSPAQTLPRYQWTHIVAQVDLGSNLAAVYVNGQLWLQQNLNNASAFTLASSATPFYIGRGNDAPMFDQFILSVANGAIDELRIYDTVLSAQDIAERYAAVGDVPDELHIDPNVRHPDDHLRPRYHPMPNTSWANEAYGFTYYQGKYHLFFQKNPNSPTLYFMHWGHLSSPDLATWKEERMALAPEPGFSDFGIWSGTTVFGDDSVPVISYTGVNGQFAGIGMATANDDSLVSWTPIASNPVIATAPSTYNHMDFRDPFIWKEGNTYYMVVGSGLNNNGGGILFSYKSSDLVNWQSMLPIYQNSNTALAGRFWEMPAMLKFPDGRYALVVTPLFNSKPAETMYWIGDFVNEKFVPEHSNPLRFEHLSRHLLSPAFGPDENGDYAYIGIIPEDRDVADQIAAGWRQTFSIPRVVRLLQDGRLGHYPHPNLCRLRQEHVVLEELAIGEGSNFNLPGMEGQQFELYAEIVPGADARFLLQVLKNAEANQLTSIVCETDNNRLGINRNTSSPYPTTENYRFEEYIFGDTVRLHVFVDHSTLEVFVDNLAVMSARVYPGEDQVLLDLVVPQGNIVAKRVDFWALGDKEATYNPDICPPSSLPDQYLSDLIDLPAQNWGFRLGPNPTKDVLYITPTEGAQGLFPGQWQVQVYDAQGQVLLQEPITDIQAHRIDLGALPAGMYIVKVQNGDIFGTGKVLKI